MRSLRLLLTIPEKETDLGTFNISADGDAGQIPCYSSMLPFADPKHYWTILKALGAVEFRPKDFQEDELKWMVEVSVVTKDKTDFHHKLQKIIGWAIYESLFPVGEPRELLQRSLAQASLLGEQLHIQIRFSKDVDRRGRLPNYPWELAYDGEQFLERKQVIFSRFIAFLENVPNLPPVEKINVLLVSSTAFDHSMGLNPLSTSESDAISEVLQGEAQQANRKIQVNRLHSPTFQEFGNYLIDQRYENAPHIIHFDGHGFFGKRCDRCRTMHKKVSVQECRGCGRSLQDKEFQGYLLFKPNEDLEQNADYVSAQEIAEQLHKMSYEQSETQALRLMVMSACKTGMALGSDTVFNGVAQRLIQYQVPAVVAMQYNVTVDAAQAFSDRFYRAIREKKYTVTQAVSLGRNAMREGDHWYRPVLYLRCHDSQEQNLFFYKNKNPKIEKREVDEGDDLSNVIVDSSSIHRDLEELDKYLKARKWRIADRETLDVILKISKIERRDISGLKPEKFPKTDLEIIDRLWQKHSYGRFGLSVQKEIWLELGQESDLDNPINTSVLIRFGEEVGWYENRRWKRYDELNFSLESKKGHFPSLRYDSETVCEWDNRFGSFLLVLFKA